MTLAAQTAVFFDLGFPPGLAILPYFLQAPEYYT